MMHNYNVSSDWSQLFKLYLFKQILKYQSFDLIPIFVLTLTKYFNLSTKLNQNLICVT